MTNKFLSRKRSTESISISELWRSSNCDCQNLNYNAQQGVEL